MDTQKFIQWAIKAVVDYFNGHVDVTNRKALTPDDVYFAFGTTNTQFGAMYNNNKYGFTFGTNSITNSGERFSFIANANSTTFQVAVFRTATSAAEYLVSNKTYYWYVW